MTYLRNSDPGELVHVSGDTYCTREHDSLKITGDKWYWFSRGFGGYTALDYLMKVKGLTFTDAVSAVLSGTGIYVPSQIQKERKQDKQIVLPARNRDSRTAISYLRSRGIHRNVILYCLRNDLIYESADRHHNVVFLGRNDLGEIRYAALRGTNDNAKLEAAGSDKRCSFSVRGRSGSGELHVFEAAVDLLSYISLLEMEHKDWHGDTYLSLAGVSGQKEGALPLALEHYLKTHAGTGKIHLHLDNDEAGRRATDGIVNALKDRYTVSDEPPECGKDVNDQLKARLGMVKKKEEMER